MGSHQNTIRRTDDTETKLQNLADAAESGKTHRPNTQSKLSRTVLSKSDEDGLT